MAIDSWYVNNASRRGNRAVITACDTFTKYLFAEAVENLNAITSAQFISRFVACFGIPRAILTDQARDFTGVICKETMDAYHIEHLLSTPGHSQGNAVVERAIQTLQDRLSSSLLSENEKQDWDDLLPATVYAINTSFHFTTKYSPFELMFGREPQLRTEFASSSRDPKDLYAKLIK